MVQLYLSKQNTGYWGKDNVNDPPKRNSAFDTLFYTSPPPGTLTLVSYQQGAMVRAIATAALWAGALLAAARSEPLDLTPVASFYEVEGVRVPNVTFRHGPRKVPYTPPGGWTLSGGGSKLTLTPPDAVQASAVIESLATSEPLPAAAPENAPAYAQHVLALLPRGASKIEMGEALVSPLRIAGRPAVEVTASYVFFGQPFRTNVLLMPRGNDQLRFTITARAADFPALSRAFRDSLFSMQGL